MLLPSERSTGRRYALVHALMRPNGLLRRSVDRVQEVRERQARPRGALAGRRPAPPSLRALYDSYDKRAPKVRGRADKLPRWSAPLDCRRLWRGRQAVFVAEREADV